MFDKEFEAQTAIDLAQPRTIVLSDRGRLFTLECRRITNADWTAFFNAISVTSEQRDGGIISVTDTTSPQLQLAEAVLVDAKGYKVAGGAMEFVGSEGWQRKLPLAHRLKLGEILADARPEFGDGDLDISMEGELVSLSCTWTATSDGQCMQKISGLKHIFATPTEEQYRRYQRAASRVKVVGGSRTGKTVYLGAHAVLADLYDELIVSADGYVVGDQLLRGRESIAREMDMHHKVMAAQMLFLPQSGVQAAMGGEQE